MSPAPALDTNPFRPGVGKPPPYLADRSTQLDRFSHYLREFPANQRNVRVTGLRGVGKTVLLKEYRKLARADDWIVIKRDLSPRLNNEGDFATAITTDLDQVITDISIVAKLGRLVTAARESVSAVIDFGDVSVTLRVGGATRPQPVLEDRLRDALIKVGQLVAKSRRGVLFLYDEAHVIQDRPRSHSYPLSALLAAFVEAQDYEDENLPVMLVMCGLPPLATNLQAARSHSERLFKVEEIGNLRLATTGDWPSPAAAALTHAVDRSSIQFAETLPQRIAEDVDGYPYFVQWYGEALWDAADELGRDTIDEDLYEAWRGQIQDGLDAEFFEGRYAEAKRAEQLTLRVLGSLGGEAFRIAELADEIKSLKQNAVQQSVNRLAQANLIYRIRYGEYAYTAPLFGDFLRRRHPRQNSDR
jgi:hypothetical protein